MRRKAAERRVRRLRGKECNVAQGRLGARRKAVHERGGASRLLLAACFWFERRCMGIRNACAAKYAKLWRIAGHAPATAATTRLTWLTGFAAVVGIPQPWPVIVPPVVATMLTTRCLAPAVVWWWRR